MYRIVKKEAILGSRKPLVFSDSTAGGYRRLTGVGVFVPAIENQFASDTIVPSSSQTLVVNPIIKPAIKLFSIAGLGEREFHLTDGTNEHNYLLTKVAANTYSLSGKEIASNSRTYYITDTNPSVQDYENKYYGKDADYAFDGTKRDTLTVSTSSASAKFKITLKKSDTLIFYSESGSFVISRTLPVFKSFNGISVRMQINNLQDNPLCDICNPKIIMNFKPNPQTTQEAMVAMKKAMYMDMFDESRLVPMNYDIKKHTKLDFIIDLNAGNEINSDYLGERCDLKVYLRYE